MREYVCSDQNAAPATELRGRFCLARSFAARVSAPAFVEAERPLAHRRADRNDIVSQKAEGYNHGRRAMRQTLGD